MSAEMDRPKIREAPASPSAASRGVVTAPRKSTDARPPLPARIYVERWPDGDDDYVHYAPTGYGISLRGGGTSTITVYRKMTRAELRTEARAITKKGRKL